MTALIAEGQQSRQALTRTSILQKVVLNKLIRRSSRLDIDTKADTQKGLEFLGKFLWLL